MARMRVFIVLVLALTSGGALAFATYNYVQNAPAKTIVMPTKPVVVAASDLDIGAELRSNDLKVVDWPANSVPSDVISDPQEIIGRGLVLPVIQNEPIQPVKLASKEAGSGLPPAIPPGLRALSVRVDEVIGVAGYVVPGTHVDVVVTVSPTQQHQDTTSKVILNDVLVLAAGTKLERDVEGNKPMPVSVVTLLVNPDEAERVTLAASEGKIQLALRNPLDRGTPATKGVRPSALIGTAPPVRQVVRSAAVTAPKPQSDLPTVEIIRGDKRAREVVRQEQ
jgi:pilus assembly protein CpaB